MAKTDKANESFYVYCHVNKINGKIYVGITKNINKRWGKNGSGYKKLKNKGCFANAIEKYGWNNFEHIILENNVTQKQAKVLEKLYIIELDSLVPNGYNLTKGGDGLEGFKQSIETIERVRKANIGRVSPRKGVKLSDETKMKISIANSGKIRSDEFKKNVSKRMKGKQYSKEFRDKISNSRKGMKFSQEHKNNLSKATREYIKLHPGVMSERSSKPVIQYNLYGDVVAIYDSVREAALWNDFDNKYISLVCNHKKEKYKNFIWRWKNEQT